MKRKVRRTIRCFFLDGQAYYRGHHIVTDTQLAAFFGQATIQRVWNPARETRQIEHALKVADGGTNRSTGVSLVLRADLYPASCIRRRFDPPVKLQGRLGGVLVRSRGLPGNQELHEKVIVAYPPLEEGRADTTGPLLEHVT